MKYDASRHCANAFNKQVLMGLSLTGAFGIRTPEKSVESVKPESSKVAGTDYSSGPGR